MTGPGSGGFNLGSGYIDITARDLTDAGRMRAQRSIRSIEDRRIRIDADTQAAQANAERVRRQLVRLGAMTPSPEVDLETAQARARLAQIQAQLRGLQGARADIDVDAAVAAERLRQIEQQIQRLPRRTTVGVNANVNSGGLSRMNMLLGAVPALAGAAAAALATLPALMGALGPAVGVLAGAFNGVGDALKGYDADQKAAAAGGGAAASAAQSNARAIRDATQAINDAKRDQARVARDTAYQIQDAERAVASAVEGVTAAQEDVADAQRDAARAARQSARAVEDAQEDLTDAVEDAASAAQRSADQVASASRRVQSAMRNEQRAQEDLDDARRDAIRTLDELSERVSDLALDQEGAAIAVIEAQEELARAQDDALATDLDVRKAKYELAVALERVSDLERESAEATAENNDAQAAGVEGAESVIEARDRLTEANQATADAEKELADSQREAARQQADSAEQIADARQRVIDAQTAQSESAEDSARRITDAQEGVTSAQARVADAERDLARTREAAAEAQEDAARRVADAMQALSDAQADAATSAGGGASAASAYADAMDKLSPAGRAFVEQLLRMNPLVEELSHVAQSAYLPGLTEFLQKSEGLFPVFAEGIRQAGEVMGQTARDFGDLVASDVFKTNLGKMFEAGLPILDAFGDGMLTLTDRFVAFGAQSAPIGRGFADMVRGMFDGLAGFYDAAVPYIDDFGLMWSTLGETFRGLGPVLAHLGGGFAQILTPLLEIVNAALPAVSALVEFGNAVAPIMNPLLTLGAQLLPAISTALEWLTAGLSFATDGLNTLGFGLGDTDTAQRAAAAGTDEHTLSLQELTGQMQSAISSDLGYQQSLFRVKDAQEAAAAAVRDHGAGSDEAQQAHLRLTQAAEGAAQAAQRKAEADAAAAGVTDTSTIGAHAYAREILGQAAALDGPARDALLRYSGHLSDAQIDAINAESATSNFRTEVMTLPDGRTVRVVAEPDSRFAEDTLNYTARQREATIIAKTYHVPVYGTKGGAGGGLVGYAGGGVLGSVPGFAKGGVIGGYAPGKDTVPAMLSKGEAVLVPELVRLLGPKNILAANWAASHRAPTAFASGGIAGIAGMSAMFGNTTPGGGQVVHKTGATTIVINIAGNLDPTNKPQWREGIRQIREAIRQEERATD
jgi:hypothetical protein